MDFFMGVFQGQSGPESKPLILDAPFANPAVALPSKNWSPCREKKKVSASVYALSWARF